ncbi:MAG: hypothetical protein EOL98_15385 [Negativicutes bacterium]|nr:hypothetical protein [Negativicutes bacterium]
MIKYLVIGSNNFWYAACTSKEEALAIAKEIQSKEDYDQILFGDPESDYFPKQPARIYIYKVDLVLDEPTNEYNN